ncbi:MAG: hypothetical protein HY557_03530 [Euryarchaeota archaeon]|nr:hypothetical protein [Euryarchaeota archaeon]
MAVNLLLHPIVGLLAIALLLAAFTAKVRTRKQYVVHYALGMSSLALSSLAFALGFLTFFQAAREGVEFEETLVFHLIAAAVLFVVLLAQARMGLAMWRRKRHDVYLARHRATARILVVLAVLLAVLGAVTFVTIR